MSDSIVIVGAARTPMGSFQGDFASLAAHDLGGAAIRAAVQRAGVAPDLVDEVLFAEDVRHLVGLLITLLPQHCLACRAAGEQFEGIAALAERLRGACEVPR